MLRTWVSTVRSERTSCSAICRLVMARATSLLSPRETEIASLVARAMTNRQIAEQLVLSERTVETHVRSILAKLGYTTRTEIATWSLRSASR